ncbi:MAG: tetraacyldisaccharide 4'-kinase [Bacteroidales bacterium]|nr:tetraacyldisaccharide 4'-kinase [Bacteroidales bacterium]
MEGDLIHINHWLKPLSWLYGIGVGIRNFLFDHKILKEQTYDCPVICIGNITVGGTGKTPHTEWLLRHLLPDYRIAVLSRGYKRKSRGFHLAEPDTPMSVIGDEPWQMKQKFPKAIVAVDANRRRGISTLLNHEHTEDVDVILLDDAFQHRYVRAGLNLLLTDYHRLMSEDTLLPAGRLREPLCAKDRAQAVIVTKCPANMKPMEYRVIQHSLHLKPYQYLFFSTFRYGNLRPLFSEASHSLEQLTSETHVLLLTGIASPQQMLMDLQKRTEQITTLFFPDHHHFNSDDIQRIETAFDTIKASKRLIITTEKDASRLLPIKSLPPLLRQHIYVLPIEVRILRGEKDALLQLIQEFITSPKS